MLISETFRIALSSIRSNLFRATLTMLGVIIGVAAVITMVALGTGAQRAIDEQMAALGGDHSGSIAVWLATCGRLPPMMRQHWPQAGDTSRKWCRRSPTGTR
jgi:ABC-type antimicrobial peptide transport system permease subunit